MKAADNALPECRETSWLKVEVEVYAILERLSYIKGLYPEKGNSSATSQVVIATIDIDPNDDHIAPRFSLADFGNCIWYDLAK